MSVYYGIFHFLMSHQVTHTFSFIVVKRAVVDVVVVVAHSTSAQQILSGWGLTVVCEPIHLGGGDSRRMANTQQCAGSNPQPSSQRASAVTTAPPCAPMITLLGRCAETEKTFSKCTRSAVKNE